MKSLLSILIIGMLVSPALGDCDCKDWPFKPDPPCSEKCFPKLLAQADHRQLTTIFGFPPAMSEKIVAFPDRSKMASLDEYKGYLRNNEISTIRAVFGRLTQQKLDKFYGERTSNPR
jgi:hypothetical protein